MRNGNSIPTSISGRGSIVLILPMRNGNFGLVILTLVKDSSSYPTYEEWKRLCSPNNFGFITQRSYPTYEEWKQIIANMPQQLFFEVLILPMRNGNSSQVLPEAKVYGVLILPMRNGNCFQLKVIFVPAEYVLILPMRNGNW